MNLMKAPSYALSHPVVVGAALLIVVNDFALRGVAPGWLTGKLSDVGWLVVVPVLLAALLGLCGVAHRWATPLALVAAGCVYTALQVWPPFGAWFSVRHVADVGDLVALPALFGAVFAWRSPRVAPKWAALGAAPVLFGSLVADKFSFPDDATWPCGDSMVWETSEPLRLQIGWWPPVDTDAFLRGLRLVDADGVDVPLVVGIDGGVTAVCARDGLRPNTDYIWEIGPWTAKPSNEVAFEHEALPTVRFRTSDSNGKPAMNAVDCVALVRPLSEATDAACNGYGDTGDSGDSGDSGDTGDTAVTR